MRPGKQCHVGLAVQQVRVHATRRGRGTLRVLSSLCFPGIRVSLRFTFPERRKLIHRARSRTPRLSHGHCSATASDGNGRKEPRDGGRATGPEGALLRPEPRHPRPPLPQPAARSGEGGKPVCKRGGGAAGRVAVAVAVAAHLQVKTSVRSLQVLHLTKQHQWNLQLHCQTLVYWCVL